MGGGGGWGAEVSTTWVFVKLGWGCLWGKQKIITAWNVCHRWQMIIFCCWFDYSVIHTKYTSENQTGVQIYVLSGFFSASFLKSTTRRLLQRDCNLTELSSYCGEKNSKITLKIELKVPLLPKNSQWLKVMIRLCKRVHVYRRGKYLEHVVNGNWCFSPIYEPSLMEYVITPRKHLCAFTVVQFVVFVEWNINISRGIGKQIMSAAIKSQE